MTVRELTVEEVYLKRDMYTLIDVSEAYELSGLEGKIEGVILATLGPALAHFLQTADPDKTYVFICRSGYRSGKACEIATDYGLRDAYNMTGGMLAWNEVMKTI